MHTSLSMSETIETTLQESDSFPTETPSLEFELTVNVNVGEPALGGVRFASKEACEAFVAQQIEKGALVVRFSASDVNGDLASLVEDEIERVLAEAGVPSPSIAPFWNDAADFETRLGHQLFRAKAAGATGITLFVEELSARHKVLSAQDSVTLHTLAERTRDAALFVLFDDALSNALGVRPPVSLIDMFAREAAPYTTKRLALEVVEVVHDVRPEPTDVDQAAPIEASAEEAIVAAQDAEESDEQEPATLSPAHIEEHAAEEVDSTETEAHAAPQMDPHDEIAEETSEETSRLDLPHRQSAGASIATDNESWRAWVLALTAARGTCTLSAFERLFIQSYMPLTEAIEAGLSDPRAIAAHEEFCRNFERSYTEAFPRFAITAKRPKLVLDVFELASKAARAHGARAAHLVMVDSMRFDTGGIVRNSIVTAMERTASLTEEAVLFASLPSTTRRQLETLSRGIESLRGLHEDDMERGDDSLRGRSAEMIRRVRVGHRDLFRLDMIEANLQEGLHNRNETAAYAGEIIAKHANELPPRTLLYVFGDHGFRIDHEGAVQQGGASPEEILVPAYAFLIGDFH